MVPEFDHDRHLLPAMKAKAVVTKARDRGLDATLLAGVLAALPARPEQRGAFDDLVLDAFDSHLVSCSREMEEEIAKAAAASREASQAACAARAARAAALPAQTTAAEALGAAQAAAGDAQLALAAARRSLAAVEDEARELLAERQAAAAAAAALRPPAGARLPSA
ncbi:unnamed protein product [Prorocentrum cordatum]|uniref:Uncharacterized protein n=1 Tax=Prorocentrum cordatum TaxID=2364126 RepID=A0ABN9W1V6_9DINO|nr:unnamed protein product [Polarella glacialis]